MEHDDQWIIDFRREIVAMRVRIGTTMPVIVRYQRLLEAFSAYMNAKMDEFTYGTEFYCDLAEICRSKLIEEQKSFIQFTVASLCRGGRRTQETE